MDDETFGAALRRLRSDRGLSLRQVGDLTNYSRQHIHDVELGKRRALPKLADALDHVLNADGHLARLVDVAEGSDHPSAGTLRLVHDHWSIVDAEAIAYALSSRSPGPDNAREIAHEWLVTEPPQSYEISGGRHIGRGLVEQVEQRIQQIRLVDDHVGGVETHGMVGVELAATAQLVREATYTEETGRRLLAAVAELCQIAGWIASDAGRYAEARHLYVTGTVAGHAAGDAPGAASNLSSLAYQNANVGDPREGLLLARSAYTGAERVATPGARALLLERVAWAHARTGDDTSAERALGQVDEAFAEERADPDPVWVYWLSPQEIEVMKGRVWTELRRPMRAVPALEHAIESYGDDIPRETSMYLSWLAEALIHGGEVEQAAAVAPNALRVARLTSSTRATERVNEVRRLLAPHRSTTAVRGFLQQLDAAA